MGAGAEAPWLWLWEQPVSQPWGCRQHVPMKRFEVGSPCPMSEKSVLLMVAVPAVPAGDLAALGACSRQEFAFCPD